jgi:2-dehydro-3-deoxy-D-gluconate 5-dehydrogenase
MNWDLQDRVAIVTGAGRGLGFAAAKALLTEGASVVGTARAAGALDELRELAPDRVHPVELDVRDAAGLAALPERAVDHFGRLDVVVNNAGIAPAGNFLEQGQSVWDEVFAVNVAGPAILSRAAGRVFLPQRSGKIINIASTSGIRGKPLLVAYSASKGAVLQFTKALAGEWAKLGVQVNAIAPGAFATDAQSAVLESEEILTLRLRKIPARRMGEPDEIGPLTCLLASPLSDFITGAVYVIDGGESSKQ